MYLLDTNICIYIIKRKPIQVINRFQKLPPGQVAISSITLSELKFGVEKSRFPDKNRKALEKFLIPLEIVNYDSDASSVYGKIRKHLA
jgi:tRNA(fMet)-specific endonuclease VapC